ncbi:unnamed protein product, partial [Rotaria magnacalcarata]
EIRISPPTSQKSPLQVSPSNHRTSSSKHLVPFTSTDGGGGGGGHVTSSSETDTRIKPTKIPFLSNNSRSSSVSIQSLPKRISTQHQPSINSSNPYNHRYSTSRQSIFDTLATT